MGSQKLIVSGLSEEALIDFDELVKAVQAVVSPGLVRAVDKSVLARFAVNSVIRDYKEDPARLARVLGFEVRA